MLRFSLRNLMASRLRLLLTTASVVVGVAFVAGTFVLSDTMVKAFDELYAGLTSGTDVVVTSESAYDADVTTTGGQVRPLEVHLVDVVRAVPGVETAEGSVYGFALVIDAHGRPVQPGGAPTFGTSIARDPRLSGAATMREGRRPTGPHQIVLDARTARTAGYRVGDRVDVVFQDARRTFRLVGIVGFGSNDSILGATMTGFDLPTAQQVLGKPGVVDEIDVRGVPGLSADTLRQRVAAYLPSGVQARTGQQVASDSTDAVRKALGVFTTVLLVFAGVSLLVGSFVIWNTFNVLVAQRRREIALLRAVGGTQRQVLGGVLLEAGVVGVVAGCLGLLAGVGLATGIRMLLGLIGVDIPSTSPAVEPRTVVAAFAVGILVTGVAALLPAWSAARVVPMEALRSLPPAVSTTRRLRHVVGWTVLLAGVVLMTGSAVAGDHRWWTVVATLVTFLGLVFVGPMLARGLAAVVARLGRTEWRMAARNIARSSRRAAATALALTIGLAVVAAVTVTAASLKESVSAAVAGGNRADLILEPAGAGRGISTQVATLMRQRRDVTDVVEMREWSAQVGGHEQLVTALDTQGLRRVVDLGMRSGSVTDLGPGRVLVGERDAEELGVGVGDTVTVTFPETGPHEMRVAGTFAHGSFLNASLLMTLPDFDANVTSPLDAAILLRTTPGLGARTAKQRIEHALTDYPNVEVNTPADLTREARQSVDQLLGIVTALLLLAVIVAVLGVVNTLVLSVMQRHRELAVLRAVGATRRQVRQVVRREAVLMSVLGALTGVALGTAAGLALARSLTDEGITTVAVPVVTLCWYVVAATGVGVVAALAPARRAGRIDVLRAVAEE